MEIILKPENVIELANVCLFVIWFVGVFKKEKKRFSITLYFGCLLISLFVILPIALCYWYREMHLFSFSMACLSNFTMFFELKKPVIS